MRCRCENRCLSGSDACKQDVLDIWAKASRTLAIDRTKERAAKKAELEKAGADDLTAEIELHWTERDARSRAKVRDVDPKHWMKVPWQSAHDGLCPTKSLAFKWNDLKPWDQRGDRKRQNLMLERYRPNPTGTSTSRADFVHHAGYTPNKQCSWLKK